MEVSYMIIYDFTLLFLSCLFSLGLDKLIYQELMKDLINLIKNDINKKTEKLGDIDTGIINFLRRASQYFQAQSAQSSQQQSEQSLQQATQESSEKYSQQTPQYSSKQ
jgi:hypothetical protein